MHVLFVMKYRCTLFQIIYLYYFYHQCIGGKMMYFNKNKKHCIEIKKIIFNIYIFVSL